MNSGLFEHIETFVAIARSRSLTAASIATGIGQATMSRQLAALEKHLGCRLFLRSTRAIKLTEHGEAYLSYALRLMEMMSAAQGAVQTSKAKMRGRIRVACSTGFAKKLLIPNLAEWQSAYPEVKLEFILSDDLSHVIEERVDVAFRIGALSDSNLVARQIGSFNRVVIASPAYLKRYGTPTLPEQLSEQHDEHQHQCILFSGLEHPEIWNFGGPLGEIKVHVASHLRMSTLDAVYSAAAAGLGIAIVPEWFLDSEFKAGQIVRLLGEYRLSDRVINAVMHERNAADGKVALFIQFVKKILDRSIHPAD